MKTVLIAVLAVVAINNVAADSGSSPTTLERMPVELETRFALSAAPTPLRERASVYLLDPAKGYALSKRGTSGVVCLVERTAWELADLRNDIFVPLCYDAAGSTTYLKVIMDAAALRAQGMEAGPLKAEIERRWNDGTYTVPAMDGVSYMVAPVMRTAGPPDMQVHTMVMPHLMFYAPHLTNEDIGAAPNLADRTSLQFPFIFTEGIAEQSYIIQLVGKAEKEKILADETALIDDLCAYREVLCLVGVTH